MRGVAENENPLARKIGRIDGARIPGQARVLGVQHGGGINAAQARDFRDEFARRANADRDVIFVNGWPMVLFQPLGGRQSRFRDRARR